MREKGPDSSEAVKVVAEEEAVPVVQLCVNAPEEVTPRSMEVRAIPVTVPVSSLVTEP